MNKKTFLAGLITQGLILGLLAFLALMKMISVHSGARIFRYEGF